MFRRMKIIAATVALALGATAAQADDRVHIDDLLPDPGLGNFLSDALYPEMNIGEDSPALSGGVNAAIIQLAAPAETELPFIAHFGFSTGKANGIEVTDGIYYSPSEGVEVTAKPVITEGLQGTVGLTVRF